MLVACCASTETTSTSALPGASLTSTGVSEPDANPRPAGLRLTHRVVDGVPVVEAVGEVDMATAPALRDAVTTALDQAPGAPCVLDLTAVTFLGSSGLTALVDATRHAQARHEPLRIVVDGTRPVIRPIQLSGLDEVLALYHTVEEALTAGK